MRLFVLLLYLMCFGAAHAASSSATTCSGFDTTTFSTTGSAVMASCTVTAGPNGIIFVSEVAQVFCAAGGDAQAQIFIGSGASPVNGSNFYGTISGTTLTVSSIVGGFGSAPWLISVGQTLFDSSSGSDVPAGITIVSQLTGTPGGVGTYSLSGPATVSLSELIYGLNAISGALTNISPITDQTVCTAGFAIENIVGSYVGVPGAQYWIGVQIASQNGKSISWTNNYLTILSY